MKYIETGFRAVYHNFAIFPLRDSDRVALEGFPGEKTADAALVYGYYDRETGMTLEVLCAAKEGKNGWLFAKGNDEIRSFIRVDAVLDVEFYAREEPDPALFQQFETKLEMLKAYDADEDIEKTRTFGFLDEARHPEFIDDVMVFLEREGLTPEPCWCRIIGLGDHSIRAILLNEPTQAFGIHIGEELSFQVQRDDKSKKVTCHAEITAEEKPDLEGLENGTLLRDAIHKLYESGEGNAPYQIMRILRDSKVWIPCKAVPGEEDQRALEEMVKNVGDNPEALVGTTFTSKQDMRMIPDLLEKDGEHFFPAFTTVEDMGDYGEHFSKVQRSFMEVICLARNNTEFKEGLKGIVINAFTEPFLLSKDLYEVVEKMQSRN